MTNAQKRERLIAGIEQLKSILLLSRKQSNQLAEDVKKYSIAFPNVFEEISRTLDRSITNLIRLEANISIKRAGISAARGA